jgi:hypothetical protein
VSSIQVWGTAGYLSALQNIGQKSGPLPVVSRSGEYRRFAAECLKIGQAAEDEQQRAIFLQMARAWLALAQRADTSPNCHQSAEDEIK